jgi:hypothetical protein
MKKTLIITLLLVLGVCVARAQSITFPDMADLVNLSIGQVDNILINTNKFKVNNKHELYGQILITYQSIDKNKQAIKGESIVTGGYRTTGDGTKLRTVTYMTIYRAYVDNLMKQIKKYGYRLTFQGADPQRNIYIFDNQINHITVSLKADHSMNSVEIRQKELGIEP